MPAQPLPPEVQEAAEAAARRPRREPSKDAIIASLNRDINALTQELRDVKDTRSWAYALIEEMNPQMDALEAEVLELKSRLMKYEPEAFGDPEHDHEHPHDHAHDGAEQGPAGAPGDDSGSGDALKGPEGDDKPVVEPSPAPELPPVPESPSAEPTDEAF